MEIDNLTNIIMVATRFKYMVIGLSIVCHPHTRGTRHGPSTHDVTQ